MPNYIALIHKDADSDYGVSFPDLPGAISAGVSLDDARAMAAEALALHLEGLTAEGEAIPEPSSLEAVMADPANRDGVAVLIAAPEGPPKVVRVNITLADDVLIEIDRYAETHGFTRSGFLSTAARRMIAEDRSMTDSRVGGALGTDAGWLQIFSGRTARDVDRVLDMAQAAIEKAEASATEAVARLGKEVSSLRAKRPTRGQS